jgi:hypothetical protein
MMNPSEHYDRLHDHMMAIARERDWYKSEVDRLTDELHLAHEALKREFVDQGITKAVNPEVEKWRNIAGNLYDEIRLRAADCLYRHEDGTKDCVNDYELADTP